MKIAITGPTGAIGTALIDEALSRNYEVIAIVNPNSSRIGNIVEDERITIVKCDISDYERIFGCESCDVFFHMAWLKTFGAERDNVYVQNNNVKYALDATRLAISWGAKVFVGIGSQAEYGIVDHVIDRNTPVNPVSGYGIAKYSAGRMCGLLCEKNNVKFNWVRVLSVYGKNDADHTLVMYLINSFLSNKEPELTECEQIWDYIYSKDVATALLLIGDKGINGKTYCLGSGASRRLKDYVEAIRDSIDEGLQIKFGVKPYYDHQPMYLTADISELTEDTGFKPNYSFERGIKELISYIRSK